MIDPKMLELSVYQGIPHLLAPVVTDMKEAAVTNLGKKFDWLYERAVETGPLKSTLSRNLELPSAVWRHLRTETDHEQRAALVCLLTAAFAAQDTAKIVGDAEGGWFWLPPLPLWQGWASEGLSSAEKKWRPR